MFRAANNPYDDVVVKATDENLTSENWALILDVCDRVSTTPTGPSSVIAALIKRLAHRNANVQLYTLELANALSQNCGAPLHRELASRSFTDALLRLANDRNTHQAVKAKVMERMGEWVEMFGKDPDLGIMEQAYEKLRAGNPGLAPPSKPVKTGMSVDDRQKEEDELQMALALSLRDKGADSTTAGGTQAGSGSGAGAADAQAGASQGVGQPAGTTAATVSRVKALYDFTPSEPGELAFRSGDIIAVLESVYKDWWKGSLKGQTGIFPLNYVEKLQDPTIEELERDAAMEGEVFSQIRNVEKLLSLLSVRQDGMGGGSRDQGSEEEITELYNQTLAIRPKLIELIGKYSQKKDDFTQLNEKFIKARRDYEALLESSMSAPQQYGRQQRHPSQPYYANAYGPPQGYPPQQQQQQQQQPQQGYPPQGPPPQDPRYAYYPPQQDAQQQPPQNAYSYPNPSATPAPGQPPSSAFHFLPNGAPAQDQHHAPKPGNLPPSNSSDGNPNPSEPSYSPQLTHSQHLPSQSQPQQQPQQQPQYPPNIFDRPHSIHTLNSGNPQELGVSGYESPVDPRHVQQLPLRQQHTSSSGYDLPSASSAYSQGSEGPYPTFGGAPPMQPGHAPPGVPGQGQGQPSYQAYNPGVGAGAGQGGSGGGGDDASDFYR